MPLIGTRGAASARGLGLFGLGGGYWFATLDGSGADAGSKIALDATNNVYVAGFASAINSILITKYNNSGALEWQRTLGGSVTFSAGALIGITSSSSGNVYVVATGLGSTVFIAKYNTSGVIQWQRELTSSIICQRITLDLSENVYIIGYSTASFECFIAKYNSSGVLQRQDSLTGYSSYGYDIKVDSSGNIYVVGYYQFGTNNVFVAKLNSSYGILWQRALNSLRDDRGYAVAFDASSNVYITGIVDNSTGALIAKYDSSGTIQWQRQLGLPSNAHQGYDITVSGSSLYIVGSTNTDILLAKYNTGGTLQWQRTITSSGNNVGYGVALSSYGDVYLTGSVNSSGLTNSQIFIGKIPADGSKTGTYVVGGLSITYASASLTDTATSYTDPGVFFGGGSPTQTDAAGTRTDAAGTLTAETTVI